MAHVRAEICPEVPSYSTRCHSERSRPRSASLGNRAFAIYDREAKSKNLSAFCRHASLATEPRRRASRLSPMECALTRIVKLSPLEYALTEMTTRPGWSSRGNIVSRGNSLLIRQFPLPLHWNWQRQLPLLITTRRSAHGRCVFQLSTVNRLLAASPAECALTQMAPGGPRGEYRPAVPVFVFDRVKKVRGGGCEMLL